MSSRIRILHLSCNSDGKGPLEIEEEIRGVTRALDASLLSDRLALKVMPHLHTSDLPAILKWRPHVVHFLGHGAVGGRLMMRDDAGRYTDVPAEQFCEILASIGPDLRLVVLNACYSEDLAKMLVTRGVSAVVGSPVRLPNDTAILFSPAFYRTLGDGATLREAFDAAKATATLHVPGTKALQMQTSEEIAGQRLFLEIAPGGRQQASHTPIALHLDLYTGHFDEGAFLKEIPNARPSDILRLSSHGAPRREQGQAPGELDWDSVACATDALVQQAKERAATASESPCYFVGGQAPHAVYAQVGRELSAWNTPVVAVNRRRDGRWDYLDARNPDGPECFFDLQEGLDTEQTGTGRVALFLSVPQPGAPPAAIPVADIERAMGTSYAGLVSLRSSQPGLDEWNAGACNRELQQVAARIKGCFPNQTGVTLFVHGPAPLALLAMRALNANILRDVALTHQVPGVGYETVLRLPYVRAAPSVPSGAVAEQARRVVLDDLGRSSDASRSSASPGAQRDEASTSILPGG